MSEDKKSIIFYPTPGNTLVKMFEQYAPQYPIADMDSALFGVVAISLPKSGGVSLSAGDLICFPKKKGAIVTFKSETFIAVNNDDILAVVVIEEKKDNG